jgi:hypothetical protein
MILFPQPRFPRVWSSGFLRGFIAYAFGAVAVAGLGASATLAGDLNWERLHPTPFRISVLDVGWNGSQYLLVGEAGLTSVSSNGVDWSPLRAAGPEGLHGVAWLDEQWWAVGAGAVYASPDGQNWTWRHGRGGRSIARSAGGRLVVVGTGSTISEGRVLTSDDGGWTWVEEHFEGPPLTCVIWTPTGFYAVGGIRGNASVLWGGVWFSADGENWEETYRSPVFLSGIAWTGSRLIAAGHRFEPPTSQSVITVALASENGRHWTVSHEEVVNVPNQVRWLEGAAYVVGTGFYILRSQDGLTWSKEGAVTSGSLNLNAVAGPAENPLAVGLGMLRARATGGQWNEVIEGDLNLYAMAAGGGRSIAVSVSGAHGILGYSFSRGSIHVSSDGGKTLTPSFHDFDFSLGPPLFHNGEFMVPAQNGKVLVSSDGQSWREEISGGNRYPYAIAAHEGAIVVVGGGCEIRHRGSDGQWTVIPSNTFAALYAVSRAHDRWIAVGAQIRTSSDGVTWQREYPPTNRELHGVASIGETTVAAGDFGTVVVRDAAGEWSLVERFSGGYFHSVIAHHGRFVIADLDGEVWSSWDGRQWQREERIPGARLRRLDVVGEELAVTGYWGDIMVGGAAPAMEGAPQAFTDWVEENRDDLPPDAVGPTDRNGPLALPNLLSFGLGIQPSDAGPSDLPSAFSDREAAGAIIFEYRRSRRATGLDYQVWRSVDLVSWDAVSIWNHRRVGLTSTHEVWQVRLDESAPAGFFRLEVTPIEQYE